MPSPLETLPLRILSATALLSLGGMAWAGPTSGVLTPGIPVQVCTGPDCPAGEGLLGDAPAHMAIIAEADLGLTCEGDCFPIDEEPYPDPYPDPERDPYPDQERETPYDEVGTPTSPGRAADLIDAARDHCSTYSIHWRIDCLGSELRAAANRLPDNRDNAVIKAELMKAAEELGRIAAANAYAAQPPVRRVTSVNGKTVRTARPIRSVAAARLPDATAAAAAVLDTLSTTLLRSASSTAARAANFERAAQAVDSAKVLLRSA